MRPLLGWDTGGLGMKPYDVAFENSTALYMATVSGSAGSYDSSSLTRLSLLYWQALFINECLS